MPSEFFHLGIKAENSSNVLITYRKIVDHFLFIYADNFSTNTPAAVNRVLHSFDERWRPGFSRCRDLPPPYRCWIYSPAEQLVLVIGLKPAWQSVILSFPYPAFHSHVPPSTSFSPRFGVEGRFSSSSWPVGRDQTIKFAVDRFVFNKTDRGRLSGWSLGEKQWSGKCIWYRTF